MTTINCTYNHCSANAGSLDSDFGGRVHEPLQRALTRAWAGLERLRVCLKRLRGSVSAGRRLGREILLPSSVSGCGQQYSVVIWSEDRWRTSTGATALKPRPRQNSQLRGRWALVGGAWYASQPAVRNDRDSQLEKKRWALVGGAWDEA